MATTEADVLWMLDLIDGQGVEPTLAGGWGVDALVGRQTRAHRDLDVLVAAPLVDAVVAAFISHGFATTVDWLPVRLELSDAERDRHIDIHPAVDDRSGGWWIHGLDGGRFDHPAEVLTTGVIGGRTVSCLSAARQVALHQGYLPGDDDLHDLAVLDRLLS